jgi:hypothetical protein
VIIELELLWIPIRLIMTGHPRGDDTSVTADGGTESILSIACIVLIDRNDDRLDVMIAHDVGAT